MHTEKQKIFDEYARAKGFNDWKSLHVFTMTRYEILQNHIFEACDLVQKEQQKRISGNAKVYNGTESQGSFNYMDDLFEDIGVTVCNDSILSENNLIK